MGYIKRLKYGKRFLNIKPILLLPTFLKQQLINKGNTNYEILRPLKKSSFPNNI